jgi:hypothetical protein
MDCYNIEITPILTLSEDEAICNIISIDGMNIMFDCGWNESFSTKIENIYKE